MNKFKFEKLIIWQDAMDYGEVINDISQQFPDKEKFNLTSQIMRAVDSVALNISEGSIGQSNPEQRKFIGYSIRSLAEVVTCLFKANRRSYIPEDSFIELYNSAFHLMNKMAAFKRNIN
ncbi:four helix bundle protein [Winogradskyella forsetii]|uniref:four helix bundle protein n=1 Tax=Winogradskyella forsetii TaxID=2686077 RepID=UPI0015BE40DF|nr:four helix bundle protein [Winogradskyella forsetii]